jgi:predicted amidohydrolase YtcJ
MLREIGGFVAVLFVLGLFACTTGSQDPAGGPGAGGGSADTIYHGGVVLTVDDRNPSAEALAVRDGSIVAVGSDEEVLALRGDETNVVDLGGLTVVPGLIDGHVHLGGLGAQAVGANLLAPPDGRVEDIDDLVQALREFADGPDVERTGWIFGMGYDDAILAEGRHPTADDLDRVSTDLPVMAVHISGHFSAVNRAGLAKIGFDASTADPEGGIIRRRPGSSEPNGVLEELASIPTTVAAISPTSEEDRTYFLQRAQELAMTFGYTTVQEGRAFQAHHDAFVDFAGRGLFEIDVVAYMDYSSTEALETDWHGRAYRDRYRVGGMKVTLDGSPQGRTAWRTKPYLLPPDGQSEGYRGYPAIPDDTAVAALYERAFANGWQVLTHANGDAAVDQFIAAMRNVAAGHEPADRRPVLIHGQLIRPDQLDALAELGVMPSLFPMHTFYWGDWYDRIIGPDAAQRISPMRSAIERGMRVTSHTDAPVALPNLMRVLAATVNRTSRSGKVMGPDERLTPMEALKTVTLWGAHQHFEEDRKGSLEVGKLADLAILSDNPLTVAPERLGEIEVVETVKEGRTVFRKGE